MGLYSGDWDPFLFLKLLLKDLSKVIGKAKKKKKWGNAFSMEKTYYDILGVSENATYDEIKSAYREQIRFFHPDIFDGNPEIAHAKTAELNEAYEVLSNRETRANYDTWLREKREEQGKSASSEQRNSGNQNVEPGKKEEGTQKEVNAQAGVRPKTVAIIILALVAAFYFISNNTTNRQAREIEELKAQLEEALEENKAKEQHEMDLQSEIENISDELSYQEARKWECYECAVLTVFYKQAFDHYSILSNAFSLAVNSPDYYRKSKANVNFNARLLNLTMENTINLYDEYCDGYDFEAQDDLDKIMDDLRNKNADALTCVLSLGSGEILDAPYELLDESEDCKNKMDDLNTEYWNIFHEIMG